jgi:hypothetical protein
VNTEQNVKDVKATAEAKYSDDNEEMTLRPTTSKATAEAKYYDDNDEMTMTLRPRMKKTYKLTGWQFVMPSSLQIYSLGWVCLLVQQMLTV